MDKPTLFFSKVPDRALDATENGFHKQCRQNKRCASARAICNLAARTTGDQCFPKQLKKKRVVTLLPKPLIILVFGQLRNKDDGYILKVMSQLPFHLGFPSHQPNFSLSNIWGSSGILDTIRKEGLKDLIKAILDK